MISTNSDKRRAVQTLLGILSWQDKSTRIIAEHVGVSKSFVHKIKYEVSTVDTSPQAKVTGKDGKR